MMPADGSQAESDFQILSKFERTLLEVRQSLNQSPFEFTKREPAKVSNILKRESLASSEMTTPHESADKGITTQPPFPLFKHPRLMNFEEPYTDSARTGLMRVPTHFNAFDCSAQKQN